MKAVIVLVCLMFQAISVAEEKHPEKRVENQAQRIVSLSPHLTEWVFELGLGDQLVGVLDYSDYPEAAKKIERIGDVNGVLVERILQLRPTLVLAWQGGNKPEDIAKLKKFGLKVYVSKTETLVDLIAEIKALGDVVGMPIKGNDLFVKFQGKVAKLDAKTNSMPHLPVPMFYQLWHDPFKTISGETWISEALELCGANNIFKHAEAPYPDVSREKILVMNPSVIVIPSSKANVQKQIEIWKQVGEVDAIKSRRFLFVEPDAIHRFGVRTLAEIERICQYFHDSKNFK